MLGIEKDFFKINSKSVFLLGISYFAGCGAQEGFISEDLQDIKKIQF
ncbi:MAG: hypothetical protein ACK4F0_02535 [Candidatus Ratteibacteria bacterium]